MIAVLIEAGAALGARNETGHTPLHLAAAKNDPKEIVIDEVAGQWLALAVVPPDVLLYALGFLLFRAFDVMKPWPAGLIDRRLKSGLGVMLDDVAAAVYAGACLLLYRHFVEGG